MTPRAKLAPTVAERPDCGHRHLVECPLTVEDWRVVWMAMLGFLETCRRVSAQAHARADKTGSR